VGAAFPGWWVQAPPSKAAMDTGDIERLQLHADLTISPRLAWTLANA
jgi:hypothetical protein